jgi:hypothetical protein
MLNLRNCQPAIAVNSGRMTLFNPWQARITDAPAGSRVSALTYRQAGKMTGASVGVAHTICGAGRRVLTWSSPRRCGKAPNGLSHELGSGRTRIEGLGSLVPGRSRRLPMLKRFVSESEERAAGNEMALHVERVLDYSMDG